VERKGFRRRNKSADYQLHSDLDLADTSQPYNKTKFFDLLYSFPVLGRVNGNRKLKCVCRGSEVLCFRQIGDFVYLFLFTYLFYFLFSWHSVSVRVSAKFFIKYKRINYYN
jgi:hypothetical protein